MDLNSKNDPIGNRIKRYEAQNTSDVLLPLVPVIIRLDGKAFHTFTKNLKKPYDDKFNEIMCEVTKFLISETNALIGYTQSDEISLLLYSNDLKTQLYFDGRIFKIISILAAKASVRFNFLKSIAAAELSSEWAYKKISEPVFDCRVFSIPYEEVSEYFIWRENDAIKNSIAALGQSVFSQSEIHGLNTNQIQELLFSERKINWNDYTPHQKRGAYFRKVVVEKLISVSEIESLPLLHDARKNSHLLVKRSEILEIGMPILTKVTNRNDVIFKNAMPMCES